MSEKDKAVDQRIFLVDKIACSDWRHQLLCLNNLFDQRCHLARAILSQPYKVENYKKYLDQIDYLNSLIKEALFLGK